MFPEASCPIVPTQELRRCILGCNSNSSRLLGPPFRTGARTVGFLSVAYSAPLGWLCLSFYNPRSLHYHRTLRSFLRLGTPPSPPLILSSTAIVPRTMYDYQQEPWSDNSSAPKIPYFLYFEEKTNFAGNLMSSTLYGRPETPQTYMPVYPYSLCLLGLF